MALLPRHRLPPPVRLLLVALVAASHGDPSSGGNSYNSSICLPQPHPCGNISISYPFYPSGASGVLRGNASSYCGYPGLGILCEDARKPILQLGGDNYTVLGIDYAGVTVTLVDSEVSGEVPCPVVDHNTTLPSASWLSFPNTTVDYLLLFLNCSSSISSSFAAVSSSGSSSTTIVAGRSPTTVSPINCSSAGVSFALPRPDAPPGDWQRACQRIVEAPVLKHALLAAYPQNDSRWSNGGYGDALRSGFQLTWERKPPACNQCEQSLGRCGYNQAGDFVGCLCIDGQVGAHNCSTDSSGSRNITRLIYIIASASCLLLFLLILAFFLARKYGLLFTISKEEPRIESFLQKNANLHPKRYTYAEVKRMTKSFAVKLGQGGFGSVYRGSLSNGSELAVKMLKDTKGNGEEFMNEVASISRTSHVNVVTLLGFCLQGSKRALIYEYMPNGSLERYAFNRNFKSENTLTWEKLFDIAIGIARGLEYLHRGCNTRIVHFDIKPHNILLDQDFCPKISDFGLAKLCLSKESAISIAGARGTIGYMAPEVYSKQFGTVSSKSDVYSYGMMVLEMVGAREKNITANSESSSQYFPQWIYEHLDDYCINASEINSETTELVRKMIVVGLWCIQIIPTERPTMTRVVEMLEGSTSSLELPPKALLS